MRQVEFGIPESQILYAPDGVGGGLPPADQQPSSEGFDLLSFYVTLNKYHLAAARAAQRILSVGIGTGSDILWLNELGKIRSPFNITGIDVNEIDLVKASARLGGLVDRAKGDTITFVRRSANELGRVITDKSIELITALNSIHLYDDPQEFFHQAALTLVRGGELFISSAYVKDIAFPDPVADARAWGSIILAARVDLKSQGFTDIPRPADPARYTAEEYVAMGQRAGLTISTEVYRAHIPREEARQLVVVDEFVAGALPGVPSDFAKLALQRGVDKTLDRSRASGLNRGWLFMRAIAP